jgi:hydroxymethylpyrimidine/phosphomethylpyrimidine kinase
MDNVLTIAGFDPSAGAGLLADIKTFEQFGVYGFGVCTAVTVQNESSFDHPGWLENDHIIEQIDCLYRTQRPEVVKIGLIRDLDTLEVIIDNLLRHNSDLKIIWDPVLKSSTGFSFHEAIDQNKLDSILQRIFLVTPNSIEAEQLKLSEGTDFCNVLVKGGHKQDAECEDLLYMNDGQILSFPGVRIPKAEKHGSGCVFSSAIAAGIAKGNSLPAAITNAKEYITEFLLSTDTLLGVNRQYYEKA